MRRWRTKAAWLGATATLIAAATALPAASPDSPESLLPPGFGDPATPPPPPLAPPAPTSPSAAPSPTSPSVSTPSAPRTPARSTQIIAVDEGDEGDEGEEVVLVPPPPPIEVPPEARRAPVFVGTLDEASGGFPSAAFGASHGKFLQTLMRRTNAPLPSRWAHIALRRALLSRTPTPAGVHPVDWIAERAWLLIRMGEADGARLLVQGVDVQDFTPKMYDVAVQAALVTADPGALCPLIEGGSAVGNPRVWPLARAMCAALGGEGGRAVSDIATARRQRGGPRGVDLLLAEKVVGAGAETRRAVTIQWDDVDRLSVWRFGLANATGLVVPDRLFATTGPQARAWQARAPLMTLADRLPYAKSAAAMGVFSHASLVQIYSMLGDDLDVAEIRDSDPGRLQVAYTGTGPERIAAMRTLWQAGGEADAYANRILTSAAATRLRPASLFSADASDLVASLFAGGFARQAGGWGALVESQEDGQADRAWAMLAVGAGARGVELDTARIEAFATRDTSADKIRAKLLVGALAGLGRVDAEARNRLTQTLGLSLGGQNDWTRALDKAAAAGEGGTVMLLAAVGLQAPEWTRVPPSHLYRIVRALRATGEEYAARMIAAEALART